jgi:hypothetical protein
MKDRFLGIALTLPAPPGFGGQEWGVAATPRLSWLMLPKPLCYLSNLRRN